jgi:TonB family protein
MRVGDPIRALASTVAITAAIIAYSCMFVPSASASSSPPDSATLKGAWRWVRSFDGGLGSKETPTSCGCDRILYFDPGGTYEFVERDSAHEYLLCAGNVAIHRYEMPAKSSGDSIAWLALENWWVPYEHNMLARFMNGHTLVAYPGSPNNGVDDALTHWFLRASDTDQREAKRRPESRLPLSARPRRIPSENLPEEGSFVYYESAPEPVTTVLPIYPDSAREAGVRGTVFLHVLVGRDGRVRAVRVAKDGRGIPGLNEAAIIAVKRWVFKPALSNNKPVAVWVGIPVHFPPQPN